LPDFDEILHCDAHLASGLFKKFRTKLYLKNSSHKVQWGRQTLSWIQKPVMWNFAQRFTAQKYTNCPHDYFQ